MAKMVLLWVKNEMMFVFSGGKFCPYDGVAS